MALIDIAGGRVEGLPKASSPLHRASAAERQRGTWQRVALEVAGTLLVLMGIMLGILTLRFVLVLMH